MISLTKNAAEQIAQSVEASNAAGMALRVAAKMNDAGMLEFGMGFDQERENDSIVESWGVTLLISKYSAPLLDDVTIDFAEVAPGEKTFVFLKPGVEPPAGQECGGGSCGSGSCGSGSCG